MSSKSNDPNYAKARSAVRDYLQSVIDDVHSDGHPLFVEFWVTEFLLNEHGPGLTLPSDKVEQLVQESESDPVSFDLAIQLAVWLLRLNEPMPSELANFAADVLSELRKRPRTHGASPYKNLVRDQIVLKAVDQALRAEPELRKYRNDESSPDSACDIVAECLREIRIPIGYPGVKTVLKRRS